MAEIALNHVGLVLGLQMSRLARSCKDWYHLLELCGVYQALLADHDGIYDPSHFNDRLLLAALSEKWWISDRKIGDRKMKTSHFSVTDFSVKFFGF